MSARVLASRRSVNTDHFEMGYRARGVQALGALCVALVVGCGGGDSGGASGDSGGASGDSGTGGSSGASGGSGGGSSGGGGMGAGPSIADVDRTLGGLNQDVPAPAVGCTSADTPEVGCLTWTAEYTGIPMSGACETYVDKAIVFTGGIRRSMACTETVGVGDDMTVGLGTGQAAIGTEPSVFEVSAPPVPDPEAMGSVSIFRDARNFATHVGGDYALDTTHDLTFKIAALAKQIPGIGSYVGKTSEVVEGYFAATLEPKSTCAPDASGFGCDRVRVRGTFNVRTAGDVQMLCSGPSGCP